MQKLVIKAQFMGIRPCEIKMSKFLLLIGEQASGKSTIAKLIYFFQTLPDTIYEAAVLANGRGKDWYYFGREIEKIAAQKFIETFGTLIRPEGFHIVFYFDKESQGYLEVFEGNDGLVGTRFHSTKGYNSEQLINTHFATLPLSGTREDKIRFREHIRKIIDDVFAKKTNSTTFLIAGRNTIVAFPDAFEKTVSHEIEKLIEEEVRQQDFQKMQRSGNERLLLDFVEWSKGVREYFKKNGQSFKMVARYLENKNKLNDISEISKKILKGEYSSDSNGESVSVSNSFKIPLKDASSGQQEALRILQGIFLAIGLRNRKEFLIVEEPEAHLFPVAQKELINAFALFLNTISEGKLIITTHSPYVLACVNILLMANYTSRQNGEVLKNKVNKEISSDFWLNPADFNAYALGGEEYRLDIKDEITGLINQNYLDTISEQLGIQFSQLYELLTQSAG